jgi:hypothetical protein
MLQDDAVPFLLVLNDMRCNAENRVVVALAYTRNKLDDLIKAEKVEPYIDMGKDLFSSDIDSDAKEYQKVFKKGGMLEWYNPPAPESKGTGVIRQHTLNEIRHHAIQRATEQYVKWLNQFKLIE